jgi:hypothetical protein
MTLAQKGLASHAEVFSLVLLQPMNSPVRAGDRSWVILPISCRQISAKLLGMMVRRTAPAVAEDNGLTFASLSRGDFRRQ